MEKRNVSAQSKNERSGMTRPQIAISILKFLLLLAIVIGIPVYILFWNQDAIEHFRSLDDTVAYLRKYKELSALIYIGAQVLQIVVSVLPGQVFQFAAGYLFGAVPGLLLSLLGAILGTSLTYFLAWFLGQDALHYFLGSERMEKYTGWLNSERAYIITFLLYLIPGLPKDLVCYAAGISRINFKAFILISISGRTPAMFGSILFGAFYMKGNYAGMIIIAVLVAILLILCFIKRKDLQSLIDSLYMKINHEQ